MALRLVHKVTLIVLGVSVFALIGFYSTTNGQQRKSPATANSTHENHSVSTTDSRPTVLGLEATPNPTATQKSLPTNTRSVVASSSTSPQAQSRSESSPSPSPSPKPKFVTKLFSDPMGWLVISASDTPTPETASPIPLYASNSFTGQYFKCPNGRAFYAAHLVDGVVYPADPGYPDCDAIFVQQ